MLIYDTAYQQMKSNYLIPLTSYSVKYCELDEINIKQALSGKYTSITPLGSRKYAFHFDTDTIMRTIIGEAQLFYIRHLIQKNDSFFCDSNEVSANWNIVTCYYNAFFSASLMLRLCHRGNVFLDSEYKKRLEEMIALLTGDVVSLDSNQFYEIKSDGNGYYIILSGTADGTHEFVWKKMDELINEIIIYSRDKSDERTILSTINKVNHQLRNTYPSQLRNRVNYKPLYGLKFIDNQLYRLNQNFDWVRYLLNYDYSSDDNSVACCMMAYSKYIEHFCNNFFADYYEIRGCKNSLLKKYNKSNLKQFDELKTQFVF